MNKSKSDHRFAGSWILAGLCLVFQQFSFLPFLSLQDNPTLLPAIQQEGEPEGYWVLTGSDASDSWLGNNYHGLESDYTPLYGENSLGAKYVQYNPKFTPTAQQTVASSLNGTCSWEWGGGSIPQELKSATGYPFSMTASASYEGSNLLGATVKAFTQIAPDSSIAYAEAYLNVDGSNTFDSQTVSANLSLPAGTNEGELRPVTLLCQIDIVTVKQVHHYRWQPSGCSATVFLPAGMQPGKAFTPQVSVVDMNNLLVKPDQETWYYNDSISLLPMTWNGKESTVTYEYICPGSDQTRTASVVIPAVSSCSATLSLPEKMVPDEAFTPQAAVVDSDGNPVTPSSQTWYYNGLESSGTMKWDGREALVRFDYVCPGETEVKRVSLTIPPAKTCEATILLPDKMEADRAFIPQAVVVVQGEGTPVDPPADNWYLNGVMSQLPMTWDGKAATVKYDYYCPLDNQTLSVERRIPAAGGGSFILVVGGLAAVAGAGLAATGLGLAVMKSDSKTDPPEQHILQVDQPYLELNLKETKPLTIQVWKIKPGGGVVPAPDASIRVDLPAEASGLAAAPVSGTSKITCLFSAPNPRACAEIPVTISARAGKMAQTARVIVKILPIYELDLAFEDPQDTRLEPGGREVWAAASLRSTPMPDARTTPDELARQIDLTLEGLNSNLVRISAALGGQGAYVRGGQLRIPLSMPSLQPGERIQPRKPTLVASFSDGSQLLQSHLDVQIGDACQLVARISGEKQADVRFDKDSQKPGWQVPDVTAYFFDPKDDDKPIRPGSDYTLDADCITFDPDVLVVSSVSLNSQDKYTIQCEIKPGISLEDFFGKNLELHQGMIKVKITPRSSINRNLADEVTYQLRPQFELFATRGDQKDRAYKGLTLVNLELVVDGEDRLPLTVGVCRSDKGINRLTAVENELDPSCWTCSFTLNGSAAENFVAEAVGDTPADQVPQLFIQSRGPVLFREEGLADDLILHLEGNLNGPSHYLSSLVDFDLDLTLVFPNLKLWVVPGRQRNTSEAWMVTYLGRDPGRRLSDTLVNVKVQSHGAGQLLTPDGDQRASVITGPDGSEQVNLWYRGLDWSNYQQGLFMISAMITNRAGDRESEPVKVAVNLGRNVSSLLADLLERADGLRLNNPYYVDGSYGFQDLIELVSMMPGCVRGPLWNYGVMISGIEAARAAGGKVRFVTDYTCNEMRDRIAEWLIARRHYRAGSLHNMETVQLMNGIEFDHFTLGGLHQYEALFLSGMGPEDDPRGLDPWWHQSWQDPKYREPDGLISNNWERIYAAETVTTLTAMTGTVALVFTSVGAVPVAVVSSIMAGSLAAYAVVTAGELGSKWEMGTVYAGGRYQGWRKGNLYTPRKVFIDEWAVDQGKL